MGGCFQQDGWVFRADVQWRRWNHSSRLWNSCSLHQTVSPTTRLSIEENDFLHIAQNTIISPNFLMWKYFGNAQITLSFGWIGRSSADITIPCLITATLSKRTENMVDDFWMLYYCAPSVRLTTKEPRTWEFLFGMESRSYATENANRSLTLWQHNHTFTNRSFIQPCNFAERGCRRRFFSNYFCGILQKSFFVEQLRATACDTKKRIVWKVASKTTMLVVQVMFGY